MQLAYVTLPGRGAIDLLLAGAVERLEAGGLALAGTVQTNIGCGKDAHCDMDLRLLPGGPVIRISVDRGPEARGCRLDTDALERAALWTEAALEGAELLVVNKFGKQEAEGRGLCTAIALALDRGLPVLVGVNGLNLPAFLAFAGGLAEVLPAETGALVDWCLAARARARAA